ncbi:hypothetical protein LOTGIDRAFT_166178 [Lottia gigantea]|uniref:Uncharacterized protein n=1 Tax=Lottia gigantea TaxID=225164 RepID=V3ZZ32_LOTGI|nr:hypothetical protein LOTGIDRAFT_166178 [Lottia gigantea]ESO87875.1 hypothetical protein LOTGIDRAFT_166178 [Lottia gigantea]
MDPSKDKHGDDVKICKELMYETTAHGCRNVLSQNRSNYMRFIWLCCVLGMGTGLFVTLHIMLVDYHTYPFNTVVKIGPKPKLKFPMVTICDLTYLRVDRFPKPKAALNVFLSRSSFGAHLELNKSSSGFIQVENTPLDEAHNISNVTVKDIFKVCMWKGQNVSCSEMWIPVFTDLGKCFVLNRNDSFDYYADSAGSHGALNFIAKIDQDSYIVGKRYMAGLKSICEISHFITRSHGLLFNLDDKKLCPCQLGSTVKILKLKLHDQHEDSRISDSGIFLSPGIASLIAVKKRSYTFLPEPFRAYGDEFCVMNSELSGRNSKSTSIAYDREACIRQCVVNSVMKDCNCRSVADLEYSTYPMCTVGQWLDCYQPALRIVGGQMGLFLGASFITVAEFLEIFLLFLWSKVKKVCCCLTSGKITKTKVLKVKPAVKDSVTKKS